MNFVLELPVFRLFAIFFTNLQSLQYCKAGAWRIGDILHRIHYLSVNPIVAPLERTEFFKGIKIPKQEHISLSYFLRPDSYLDNHKF